MPQKSLPKRGKQTPQPSIQRKIQQYSRSTHKNQPKFWPWIIAVAIVALIGLACWYGFAGGTVSPGNTTSASVVAFTPTVLPTPTPTLPPASWRTVQTFTGADTNQTSQPTQKFTVAGQWQITWNCQGIKGVDEWLYIAIYNPDGSLYNSGAQITCLASQPVIGSAPETDGGTYYMTINASTDWQVVVQERLQ